MLLGPASRAGLSLSLSSCLWTLLPATTQILSSSSTRNLHTQPTQQAQQQQQCALPLTLPCGRPCSSTGSFSPTQGAAWALHQCRWLSADADKAAALQRLARASRHRTQIRERRAAAARTDAAAPETPATAAASPPVDAVTVTPSETVASELQTRRVVDHSALVITRPIEWGTVIFGYEQANKYQVYDQDGTLVALIAEDYTGLGNELGRQLLRTRRSFTATVFSADGTQVIFRVRRPAYLITSSMLIEAGDGTPLGEVHRRWSLLQRNYDLYDGGKRQFAAIAGNFLAWEFELKDSQGGTLAFIDRNFQGFGKEIFTDAGKYVIHFGAPQPAPEAAQDQAPQALPSPQQQQQQQVSAPLPAPQQGSGGVASPPVTTVAQLRTGVSVIPTATGNQLVVARPLELSERMITLACAISIDYDFFSQHSHGGGLVGGMMPMPIPVPMPMPGSGGAAPDAGAGEAAGGVAGGAAGAGGAVGAGGPVPDAGGGGGGFGGAATPSSSERDFGGDGWAQPPEQGSFGQSEQEIKWDDGSGAGGGGDGGEGAGSIIGTLWGWVTGSDE